MNKPLPAHPRRVLLVNPTKYLGNLLLAGGLMQHYAQFCRDRGVALKIVIDEDFRELTIDSFPADSIIWFPRARINSAGFLRKPGLYLGCLEQLRDFGADLAFNIEEDTATSYLTRLSGADFRLGCSTLRHKRGYDHVLPLQFEHRAPGREHRWYSYYEVFAALGMAQPQPAYLQLHPGVLPDSLKGKLRQYGLQDGKSTVALHAGATKDYKQWPAEHFAVLAQLVSDAGLQPVLLGAGAGDRGVNARIAALLKEKGAPAPVDLCSKLTLHELAQFLGDCAAMVGNDSGPFHLGSALGVPGLVLWGPTNKAIWGPLGKRSEVVQGTFPCDPACNKGYCLHDHRCLKEISPTRVFDRLQELLR